MKYLHNKEIMCREDKDMLAYCIAWSVVFISLLMWYAIGFGACMLYDKVKKVLCM